MKWCNNSKTLTQTTKNWSKLSPHWFYSKQFII